MITAIDQVTSPCPKSEFKDDRHAWRGVMSEDRLRTCYYHVKQCYACGLVALMQAKQDLLDDQNVYPRSTSRIIHAFYHEEP